MGEIIDLEEIRKQCKDKEKDEELDALYCQLEDLMKKLEDDDPIEFFGLPLEFGLPCSQEGDTSDIVLSPSIGPLYNAYYSLIAEEREDLAELVADIIKMV